METITKGQQITSAIISKNCREVYGINGALKIAVNELIKKYEFAMSAKVNKDATIRIVMTVDRDV